MSLCQGLNLQNMRICVLDQLLGDGCPDSMILLITASTGSRYSVVTAGEPRSIEHLWFHLKA